MCGESDGVLHLREGAKVRSLESPASLLSTPYFTRKSLKSKYSMETIVDNGGLWRECFQKRCDAARKDGLDDPFVCIYSR